MKQNLIITALFLLGVIQSCSPDITAINPAYRMTRNRIIISNRDRYNYNGLDLIVNENYHFKSSFLGMGDSLSVLMRDFATKDGTRFEPVRTKVVSLSLHVENGPGKPGLAELLRN
jgi:hypothetical protein